MSTTISINKQNVSDLLRNGAEHPFVIPEYQRPYAWGSDQIQTLFEDIWDFTVNMGGSKHPNEKYFLGSIVSYENESGEQEIIDGQQRITSLFLLLRAIYTKLNAAEQKTDEARNFIEKIAPTIWRADKLTGKINYNDILIVSRVISNEGNEILRQILESGQAREKAKDNYSKNYLLFQKLYAEHCEKDPLAVYNFIYALLNQAIVLPITADSQDTALTIFSTLNDRGMPLSDADIFKAKMYNNLAPDEKQAFVDRWQGLTEEAERAGENIQNLFTYYMFYLRARDNDRDTTTPGVRKYYSANKFKRLYSDNVMSNLAIIAEFLKVWNKRIIELDEEWTKDMGILQALDILSFYPNDFGKYPVIIFYLTHYKEADFSKTFLSFLQKFLREITVKYVLMPSVTSVKGDILSLNVNIIKSNHPAFEFRKLDESNLKNILKTPHYKTVRMLLSILAYEEQTDSLLPNNPLWEIEHILPQKWQPTYFTNESTELVQEKIESLGNKIPFEKKLNIVASNGYFAKKKGEYAKSNIAVVKRMAQHPSHDWKLDDISERSIRLADKLLKIFADWNNKYEQASIREEKSKPSPEQLKQIEEFKKNGWI
ncbi:MAG: DUF262 domain-containing protein [Oligosphaeraceae bacterium]